MCMIMCIDGLISVQGYGFILQVENSYKES